MPSGDIEFNHAIIYVGDVERSLHFYQHLLGFKLIEKYNGYARLRSPKGRTTIALHKGEGKQPSDGSKRIALYFETKSLNSLCKKLAKNGVLFSQMPKLMQWGWKHAYLEDPDGHELSLYSAGRKRFGKTSGPN